LFWEKGRLCHPEPPFFGGEGSLSWPIRDSSAWQRTPGLRMTFHAAVFAKFEFRCVHPVGSMGFAVVRLSVKQSGWVMLYTKVLLATGDNLEQIPALN